MTDSRRDGNFVNTIIGVSSIDLETPTPIAVNPATGAVLIDPANLDSRYVNVTGDTMTGNLVMDTTNYIEFENTETRLSSDSDIGEGPGFLILDGVSGSSVPRGIATTGNMAFYANTTSPDSGGVPAILMTKILGVTIDTSSSQAEQLNGSKNGLSIDGFFREADSGTHERFSLLYLTAVNVEDHGASVTNTSILHIPGPMTATVTGKNYSIWVEAGETRLDGLLTMGSNNITMTGSLAATGARVTKGWFTDIESTNMPTVGGTSLNDTFVNVTGDTMTGTLTLEDIAFNGGTGTNTIDLPDNLADALSITSGGEDVIVFDTTDGAEQITMTRPLVIEGDGTSAIDFKVVKSGAGNTGNLAYFGDDDNIHYALFGQSTSIGNTPFLLSLNSTSDEDGPLIELVNEIDILEIFYEGHSSPGNPANAWLIQANETIRFESFSNVIQFKGRIQIGQVENKIGVGDPIIEWYHDGTDGFITASAGKIFIPQLDTGGASLKTLGDSATEMEVRRTISNIDNTNVTGSGTIQFGGDFTNATNLTYRVEITTGGSVGTAIFRWSDDDGGTWDEENITSAISPVNMNNGLKVWFITGTFNANDYATVTAIGTNNQKKTLTVDTRNNKTILDGNLEPLTDSDLDIGSTTKRFSIVFTDNLTGNTITLDGTTGVNVLTITDNVADALSVVNGSDDFMVYDTTNSAENLQINHDVRHRVGKKVIFDAP